MPAEIFCIACQLIALLTPNRLAGESEALAKSSRWPPAGGFPASSCCDASQPQDGCGNATRREPRTHMTHVTQKVFAEGRGTTRIDAGHVMAAVLSVNSAGTA